MELATVHLKLSGQTQNTVVKHNVTPAQLAMYAFMHGEDCVQSLTITGIEKNRKVHEEMNRLRMEFTSDHSAKCLAQLFPGMHPALPPTFRAVGYDHEMLRDENTPAYSKPVPRNEAETSIMSKIQQAEAARKAEAQGGNTAVVTAQDLTDELAGGDILDDTGGFEDDEDDGEDNALDLGDDPIDAELNRLQEPPAA